MITPLSFEDARRRMFATLLAPYTASIVVAGRPRDIRAYLEATVASPCLVRRVRKAADGLVEATVVHRSDTPLQDVRTATGACDAVQVMPLPSTAFDTRGFIESIHNAVATEVRVVLWKDVVAVERDEITDLAVAAFGQGDVEYTRRSVSISLHHPIEDVFRATGDFWGSVLEHMLPIPAGVNITCDGITFHAVAPIVSDEISEGVVDETPEQRRAILRIAGEQGATSSEIRRAHVALSTLAEGMDRIRESIPRRGGGGFDETGYIKAVDFGPDEPLNVGALSDYEEYRLSVIGLAEDAFPLLRGQEAVDALTSDEGLAEVCRVYDIDGNPMLESLEALSRDVRRAAGMATEKKITTIANRCVMPGGDVAGYAMAALGHRGVSQTQAQRAALASITPSGLLNLASLARWGAWLAARGAGAEYDYWAVEVEPESHEDSEYLAA